MGSAPKFPEGIMRQDQEGKGGTKGEETYRNTSGRPSLLLGNQQGHRKLVNATSVHILIAGTRLA